MVRFLSTQSAEDRRTSGRLVEMALSSSTNAVSLSEPSILRATLRNNTQHMVSGVTANIIVPPGWIAEPVDTKPRALAGGGSTTMQWKLRISRDVVGTVGEVRVHAQYGIGDFTGQLSDAMRLTAGALLEHNFVTATATNAEFSHPAQAAVDGNNTTFWKSDVAKNQPAVITLDLHNAYQLAGLTYLPRQDGDVAGWIEKYGVLVSSDGTTYTQVSRGSWGFDAGLQAATFDATNVRYVRLVNEFHGCLTPTHSQAMSAAEINLVLAPSGDSAHSTKIAPLATMAVPIASLAVVLPFDHVVPHSSMTVTATSQQTESPVGNAIDDSACTVWKASSSSNNTQSIILDLGKRYNTTGIAYLPPQDGQEDVPGNITEYEIAVSLDNKKFRIVAKGLWEATKVEKYLQWSPTAVQFIRLTAIHSFTQYDSYGPGSAAVADVEIGYR